MMRKKTGLIVWGAILLGFGLLFMLSSLTNIVRISAVKSYYDMRYLGLSSFYFLMALSVNLAIGGGVMLGFGIRNAVLVNRQNGVTLAEARKYAYNATCFRCGTAVNCTGTNFAAHPRYPEGFVYCPVCRTPLSKNLFAKVAIQYRA